eukprot:SM000127S26640  [mRNA]  locus=s127:142098:142919:- [translate_table: standard]
MAEQHQSGKEGVRTDEEILVRCDVPADQALEGGWEALGGQHKLSVDEDSGEDVQREEGDEEGVPRPGAQWSWPRSRPRFLTAARGSGCHLASSPETVYRMRLAVSLQRSMARALHLRAGRALAAASGSGQGTYFQEHSLSDLRLLSRGY